MERSAYFINVIEIIEQEMKMKQKPARKQCNFGELGKTYYFKMKYNVIVYELVINIKSAIYNMLSKSYSFYFDRIS